jgi:hypothetical protein
MEILNWQQYGLKKDPFDTFPLVEGGDIAIEKAFIGRDKEKEYLDSIFTNNDRVCLTVCGDVGIGKTSLANFHKFLFKYQKIKLLFSARREIEAHEDLLNKRSFLLEILSSTIREIELINSDLLKKDPLQKIRRLTDITQTMSISGGLSGGNPLFTLGGQLGSESNITLPPQIAMATLEAYFFELVEFIKNNEINGYKYSGIIFHINNFDVVLSEDKNHSKIIKFFNEIRDILQTKDTYFIFLGPKNFFKDIIAKEPRVKGIFMPNPLMLNPLGKMEIVSALEERMKLLQSDDVEKYIKPFTDDIIYELYDFLDGDIRRIMTSLRDILAEAANKEVTKTLSLAEAKYLLAQHRWETIETSMNLTEDQKNIFLNHIVKSDGAISQKEVALKTGKAQSNISGYYFRPLKDAGVIEETGKKEGKTVYWDLTSMYRPLKWLQEGQQKIVDEIQPKLF